MRNRTRSTILKSHVWGGTYCNEQFTVCAGTQGIVPNVSFPAHVVPAHQIDERISDTVGRGLPHAVTHRKREYRVYDPLLSNYVWHTQNSTGIGEVVDIGAGPYWTYFNHSATSFYCPWDVGSNTSLPKLWSVDISTIDENRLKENVLEKARQLKADVLLNVVEANQMWPSLMSFTKSLPKIGEAWKNVRRYIKHAPGQYLAWKFGISPVLSDMIAVHKHMPNLVKDIKRHANSEHQRFASVGKGVCAFDDSRSSANLNSVVITEFIPQGYAERSPEVRYVLVTKPNVKYYSDFFKKADYFMSRFATSPASLAWEKVPFSFVVDWFVDLRGALRALDTALGFAPYEIVSFTRSHSYQLRTSVDYIRRHPCTGAQTFNSRLGESLFTHYERSVVKSEGFSLGLSHRFGKNQAGIAAALIIQQLARIRAVSGIRIGAR